MSAESDREAGSPSVPPARPIRTSTGRIVFAVVAVLLLLGAVVLRLLLPVVAGDAP